jgi:glutamate synthase (NADPH/NADH) small chain
MFDEAEEEGVKFRFEVQAKSFQGDKGNITDATINSVRISASDDMGKKNLAIIPEKEFKMKCSTVLLAIGRGPNSFLQKKAGLDTGKRNSIAISNDFKTSIDRVFAAGDVTSGETLIVKAMEKGREAAQRVHEFLMNLESSHVSFYEKYYENLSYDKMISGHKEVDVPPD